MIRNRGLKVAGCGPQLGMPYLSNTDIDQQAKLTLLRHANLLKLVSIELIEGS